MINPNYFPEHKAGIENPNTNIPEITKLNLKEIILKKKILPIVICIKSYIYHEKLMETIFEKITSLLMIARAAPSMQFTCFKMISSIIVNGLFIPRPPPFTDCRINIS